MTPGGPTGYGRAIPVEAEDLRVARQVERALQPEHVGHRGVPVEGGAVDAACGQMKNQDTLSFGIPSLVTCPECRRLGPRLQMTTTRSSTHGE